MLSGIFALIVTALFVEVARRLAPRIGLVDKPCDRKAHKGDVPLVGGISIFAGLVLILGLGGNLLEHWAFMLAALMLVGVGVWDDMRNVTPEVRLGIQAGAILVITLAGGFVLRDLGGIVPVMGSLNLGLMAIPFTVFAGVGAVNAFNMSDGVDGHCGTLTLVALTGLGVVAAVAGRQPELLFILTLAGGLLAFLLIFNVRIGRRRSAKVFLGDAGSYLLGLSVLYLAIRLSQGPNAAMPPVAALWFCMIPLIDTVGMILRRIRRGRSPFSPDREHIHHVFLHAKFTVTETLVGLSCVAVVGMIFGLTGTISGMSEAVMLAAFLVVGVLYYAMIMRAWKVMRFLSRSINRRAEVRVDRRVAKDRRQRNELYYVDGTPFERRSGIDRRQSAGGRRSDDEEQHQNVVSLPKSRGGERPGSRAARTT